MKYKRITGRPPMVKEIKEARELVFKHKLSIRDTAQVMSKRFHRTIHKTSVARWIDYPVHKIIK